MRRYSRSPSSGGSRLPELGRNDAFGRLGGSLAGSMPAARASGSLGFVADPGMGWAEIQAAAASSRGTGGRVLFGEGVWACPGGGVDVTVSSVEFVAISPGRSVIERGAGVSNGARGAVVDVGAVSDVVFRGLVFRDLSGPSTGCLVRVTDGTNVRFEDCTFVGGWDGIHIVRGEWVSVVGCRFVGLGGPLAWLGSGAQTYLSFVANRIESAGAGGTTGATCVSSCFSANVFAGGTLTYKGAVGSAESGTVGTVVVT